MSTIRTHWDTVSSFLSLESSVPISVDRRFFFFSVSVIWPLLGPQLLRLLLWDDDLLALLDDCLFLSFVVFIVVRVVFVVVRNVFVIISIVRLRSSA